MPPQIILDTNVLYSGMYSRFGASFTILNKISAGEIEIHLSVPLVLQYQDVLTRNADKLEMDISDIAAVIDRMCAVSKYHEIYYLWRPVLPDPKDDLVLELAVAAQCPQIVSHNIRDFAGAESFGIAAISPIEFMRTLGARP